MCPGSNLHGVAAVLPAVWVAATMSLPVLSVVAYVMAVAVAVLARPLFVTIADPWLARCTLPSGCAFWAVDMVLPVLPWSRLPLIKSSGLSDRTPLV